MPSMIQRNKQSRRTSSLDTVLAKTFYVFNEVSDIYRLFGHDVKVFDFFVHLGSGVYAVGWSLSEVCNKIELADCSIR